MKVWAVVAGVVAAATLLMPALVGARRGPHISAKPTVVAVNQATALVGTGFPADERIILKECAATGWLAPVYPCEGRSMAVKTDASGAFTARFQVSSCSGVKKPKRQHRCYVGEYEMGEDGGALIGAVKLLVTP